MIRALALTALALAATAAPLAGEARAERAAQARMAELPQRAEGAGSVGAARRPNAEPKAEPKAVPRAVKKAGGKLEKKEDQVAGGTHWRIETDAGAVHAWVPAGYDRETAGTVVYVHGYYTNSDGAWRSYELAKQFRASKQNALFIVPDAPSGNGEVVKWPALTDLRRAMARANIRIPDGPTVVMGHSGAFRTVMKWVDHKVVAQVILLDALYGGEKSFDDFIGTGKRADHHKLIVIGADTAEESRGFIKRYPFAVARDGMPATTEGFTKREKRAKLLYVKSQFGHMAIVTSGKVIPQLLRLTPLGTVGDKGEGKDGEATASRRKIDQGRRAATKLLWPLSSVPAPIAAPAAPAPAAPAPAAQ